MKKNNNNEEQTLYGTLVYCNPELNNQFSRFGYDTPVDKTRIVSRSDFHLATVHDYDESKCRFTIDDVFVDPNKLHHLRFIERNEKIRKMNQLIEGKLEENICTLSDLEEYQYNVRKWNDILYEEDIKPFGVSEAKKCFSSQLSTNFGNLYHDVMGTLALAYCEALPYYNPYITAPTTFFKMKFKAAIMSLKCRDRNISQHYVGQFKKISEAVSLLYMRYGCVPDEEAILSASGLKPTAYKNTIEYFNSARLISVEDTESFNPGNNYDTPERVCMRNEESQIIQTVIDEFIDELNDEERLIFTTHLDYDGDLTKFPEVAERLGMSPSRVRRVFANLQRQLQSDERLREIYSREIKRYKRDYIKQPVTTSDNACSIITNGIQRNKQHKS